MTGTMPMPSFGLRIFSTVPSTVETTPCLYGQAPGQFAFSISTPHSALTLHLALVRPLSPFSHGAHTAGRFQTPDDQSAEGTKNPSSFQENGELNTAARLDAAPNRP